jgi:hypothetical protein
MTSLTGTTEMKLEASRKPVPYAVALFGAVAQLGTVVYVWSSYTSAGPCMGDPLGCLAHFSESDAFGRQVVLTFLCAFLQWVVSVAIGQMEGTPSDPSIVDRLWSILPFLYVWHMYISSSGPGCTRLLLMAVLSSVWGYVCNPHCNIVSIP